MRSKILLIVLIIVSLVSGCSASTAGNTPELNEETTQSDTVALQLDEDIQIENADEDVWALKQTEEQIATSEEIMATVSQDEDMSLFTPEDIELLEELQQSDWGYEEDPSWILRFKDNVLIIGQENGQVTDVLKYEIAAMNHEKNVLIIHVVARLNEHSTTQVSIQELDYYCQLTIMEDLLTYVNKVNSPDQMTETVWKRK